MAQLSAESALYCRIFTEGMLGLEPTGFHAFTLRPTLPREWDHLALRNIKAFNTSFDVTVRRHQRKLEVQVTQQGKVLVRRVVPHTTLAVRLQ